MTSGGNAPPSPQALSQRIHGGPDAQGVPPHDFSSNSNACGPCPAALYAIRQADLTLYPDASYTALRLQLAEFHQVAVHRIVLAASASEFIFRISSMVAQQGGQAVWLPAHSYGDYAHAARAFRLAPSASASQAQLCWACEPSSPHGAAHPDLAGLLEQAGGPLVLDRAYEPLRLSGAASLSDAQADRVWQLWTPNKALGLTGIRAAYAIAPPGSESAVEALNQLCPSWPVGAPGVAMLQAWVQARTQDWLADSLATLRSWKDRQLALLASMGWTCLPGEANFFCASPALPSGHDLPALLAALRVQGIKLRDTSSFGLPGHVRISVQRPATQDILYQALTDINRTRTG